MSHDEIINICCSRRCTMDDVSDLKHRLKQSGPSWMMPSLRQRFLLRCRLTINKLH